MDTLTCIEYNNLGLPPMIINHTRYNTEDIAKIVNALWSPRNVTEWVLTVKYASKLPDEPFKMADSGPYVKFSRNGDENSNSKLLVMAHPNKMKCDPLLALAAIESRCVPAPMLYEVVRRIELIESCHKAARGSKCSDLGVYLGQNHMALNKKFYEDKGIVSLRFEDADPVAATIDSQTAEVTAQKSYIASIVEFNISVRRTTTALANAARNRANAKRELGYAADQEREAASEDAKARNELTANMELTRLKWQECFMSKQSTEAGG